MRDRAACLSDEEELEAPCRCQFGPRSHSMACPVSIAVMEEANRNYDDTEDRAANPADYSAARKRGNAGKRKKEKR